MSHHMLHVRADDRFPVLVDLTAAPGRSLVFTRTKRGAKMLTKKLVAAGVPAVELHGNLAQAARTRNMSDFSAGRVRTLVATDIAARGIHVDDVALVIHADPPAEHKAYLHRSGRTARAGATGTVVTLMTDAQTADVRDLARRAGIKPTTTRLGVGDPLLAQLAPGQRSFVNPDAAPASSGRAPERLADAGTRRPGRRRAASAGRNVAAERQPDSARSTAAGRTQNKARGSGAGRTQNTAAANGTARTTSAPRTTGTGTQRSTGTEHDATGTARTANAGRGSVSETHAPRPTRSRRGGRGRNNAAGAAPAPRSGEERSGAAAFSARTRAGGRSR
jgi:superfamily II DNA/RNA helicase